MTVLVKDAETTFGGFWMSEEPWLSKYTKVRDCDFLMKCCDTIESQMSPDQRVQVPLTTMASEFGPLTYTDMYKKVLEL